MGVDTADTGQLHTHPVAVRTERPCGVGERTACLASPEPREPHRRTLPGPVVRRCPVAQRVRQRLQPMVERFLGHLRPPRRPPVLVRIPRTPQRRKRPALRLGQRPSKQPPFPRAGVQRGRDFGKHPVEHEPCRTRMRRQQTLLCRGRIECDLHRIHTLTHQAHPPGRPAVRGRQVRRCSQRTAAPSPHGYVPHDGHTTVHTSTSAHRPCHAPDHRQSHHRR